MKHLYGTVFLVLVGCAAPQSDFLPSAQQNLNFEKSFSQFEDVEIELSSRVTVRSLNKDFASFRRVERELTPYEQTSAPAPLESLEDLALKTFLELFPNTELRILKFQESKHFVYVTAQQTFNRVDIQNATASLRLLPNGEWTNLQSHFVDPALLKDFHLAKSSAIVKDDIFSRDHVIVQRDHVIYPEVQNGELRLYDSERFGVFSNTTKTEMMVWLDRKKGDTIATHDLSTHAEIPVVGTILPNAPDDTPIETIFPFVRMELMTGSPKVIQASNDATFDASVLMGASGKITLENNYFKVVNDGGPDNTLEVEIMKDVNSINMDEGSTLGERNIYFWLTVARDYLHHKLGYKEMDSHNDLDGADKRLVAISEHGYEMDNAFFNPLLYTLAFGTGKKVLKNTALSRDVILHEYGHAYTQEIYGMQTSYEFRAMNEAFSDYFAATITNNPKIGEEAMRDRPYLRTVENNMVWPKDMNGKYFHLDGQVFSGALWDMRKELGSDVADPMIHEARLAQAVTVQEFLRELLWIDELQNDDGDWRTGSPNADIIWNAFMNHGLHSKSAITQGPPEDLTEPWTLQNHWGAHTEL